MTYLVFFAACGLVMLRQTFVRCCHADALWLSSPLTTLADMRAELAATDDALRETRALALAERTDATLH